MNATPSFRPRNAVISQGEHVVGAGIADDVPETLVELAVTVWLENAMGILERPGQVFDGQGGRCIPPRCLGIPVPLQLDASTGWSKTK